MKLNNDDDNTNNNNNTLHTFTQTPLQGQLICEIYATSHSTIDVFSTVENHWFPNQ